MPGKRTKKELALELFEQNQHEPTNKLVKIFVRELHLPSENSARTHISLSKKKLASKLQLNYKSRKIDSRKTKKGKAMELFNNNKHLTRKEMIELFMDELDMTEASASTHCSQCAQEYTGPKHNSIV